MNTYNIVSIIETTVNYFTVNQNRQQSNFGDRTKPRSSLGTTIHPALSPTATQTGFYEYKARGTPTIEQQRQLQVRRTQKEAESEVTRAVRQPKSEDLHPDTRPCKYNAVPSSPWNTGEPCPVERSRNTSTRDLLARTFLKTSTIQSNVYRGSQPSSAFSGAYEITRSTGDSILCCAILGCTFSTRHSRTEGFHAELDQGNDGTSREEHVENNESHRVI